MNGELAQLIALAAHGNAFLAGDAESAPDLLSSNSTFQYVHSVEFVVCPRWRRARLQHTAAWFEHLRTRGVNRLAVFTQPRDPVRTAFAGGGSWWLAAHSTKTIEGWAGRWSVREERPPDNRIWLVTYRCFRMRRAPGDRYELGSARAGLRSALEEAEQFARGSDTGPKLFADTFADARRLLETHAPDPPYHPDMFPAYRYSLEARRLLAAATSAWVFGGMGSWNDVWLEDAQLDEYRRVTDVLYSSALSALAAATNSFPSSTVEAST